MGFPLNRLQGPNKRKFLTAKIIKKGGFMDRMPELILISAIFILFFGGLKLLELGAALGRTIREFKKNVREIEGEIVRAVAVESKSLMNEKITKM
jgi:TatA/E family protein of Tat protein translocase